MLIQAAYLERFYLMLLALVLAVSTTSARGQELEADTRPRWWLAARPLGPTGRSHTGLVLFGKPRQIKFGVEDNF